MSLREQIAERLHAVDPSDGKSQWADARLVPKTFTAYLNMAVEVIRLMEWARHQMDQVASYHWGGDGHPECGDPNACCVEFVREHMKAEPLTLPPEDWKP